MSEKELAVLEDDVMTDVYGKSSDDLEKLIQNEPDAETEKKVEIKEDETKEVEDPGKEEKVTDESETEPEKKEVKSKSANSIVLCCFFWRFAHFYRKLSHGQNR